MAVVASAAPAASASPAGPAVALLISGPAAATFGDDSKYSYDVTAVDAHGAPTLIPEGSRLLPPNAYSPVAISGGGWDWNTWVLTIFSGMSAGLYGGFSTSGNQVFSAYLPGVSTPSTTKTVTVYAPP